MTTLLITLALICSRRNHRQVDSQRLDGKDDDLYYLENILTTPFTRKKGDRSTKDGLIQ